MKEDVQLRIKKRPFGHPWGSHRQSPTHTNSELKLRAFRRNGAGACRSTREIAHGGTLVVLIPDKRRL